MMSWIEALLTTFMALYFFFITVNFIIAILMLMLWGIAIFALGATASILFHLMIGV